MIEVKRKTEQEFVVTIKEKNTKTEHIVNLDSDYYQYLTCGEMAREKLIEKSFKFLLMRESKESILQEIDSIPFY